MIGEDTTVEDRRILDGSAGIDVRMGWLEVNSRLNQGLGVQPPESSAAHRQAVNKSTLTDQIYML